MGVAAKAQSERIKKIVANLVGAPCQKEAAEEGDCPCFAKAEKPAE